MEQEILTEIAKIQSFLGSNPTSDWANDISHELHELIEDFQGLPEEISQLATQLNELTADVRGAFEEIEQLLTDVGGTQIAGACSELQQELSADARHAADTSKELYENARLQLGAAVSTLGSHLTENIDHIDEDLQNIASLFHELKGEITGTLESLSAARKDVLALTSPLRETTGTVAEALKIATEVFEGVG